ncbi:MAG TPA: serine hydrolase domain-containing protein, partial [Candidatus Limnocylindria bacterium]|nr:serine hydrolase domain-containing protein [Candidatus Limnocylindria bacterium]
MDKDFLGGLGEAIERGMKRLNVPGASVAVTRGKELLFSEAFGYADLEKQAKMKTTTLLPIGSCSKSFTAAAVVMLAGEGKLDLDQPVRRYMPEFDLADPVAAREATARE